MIAHESGAASVRGLTLAVVIQLLAIVFAAGMLWQKVDLLTTELTEIRRSLPRIDVLESNQDWIRQRLSGGANE